MAEVGVRKYLNEQGIGNDQIGWDNVRKVVQVGGKDFYKPPTITNGVSYGDPTELAKAYQSYTNTLAAPKAAMSTMSTNQPDYSGQMNDLLKQIQAKVSMPTQPFSYNPQSDPQYQSALQLAQQNAQTGNNANMAEMNRRNILNSTITSDRGAEIQQQELGRVTSEVLPQLMAQAYQRYTNEQNQNQRGLENLMNLANTYGGLDQQQFSRGVTQADLTGNYNGQRTLAGQTFDYGKQRDQVADQHYQQDFEYQKARDQIADQRYKQEFDEDVRRFGLNYALQKAQFNNQLSNQAADNARQLSSQNFNQLMQVWQATGKAPAGLESFGVKPGSTWGADGAGRENDKEIQGLFTGLSTGQLSAAAAFNEINQRKALGLISQADADKQIAFINEYTGGKTGTGSQDAFPTVDSTLVKNITNNLLTTEQMQEAWRTDQSGKAAGVPYLDWVTWIRNKNGYQAGIPFNVWNQSYGAIMK